MATQPLYLLSLTCIFAACVCAATSPCAVSDCSSLTSAQPCAATTSFSLLSPSVPSPTFAVQLRNAGGSVIAANTSAASASSFAVSVEVGGVRQNGTVADGENTTSIELTLTKAGTYSLLVQVGDEQQCSAGSVTIQAGPLSSTSSHYMFSPAGSSHPAPSLVSFEGSARDEYGNPLDALSSTCAVGSFTSAGHASNTSDVASCTVTVTVAGSYQTAFSFSTSPSSSTPVPLQSGVTNAVTVTAGYPSASTSSYTVPNLASATSVPVVLLADIQVKDEYGNAVPSTSLQFGVNGSVVISSGYSQQQHENGSYTSSLLVTRAGDYSSFVDVKAGSDTITLPFAGGQVQPFSISAGLLNISMSPFSASGKGEEVEVDIVVTAVLHDSYGNGHPSLPDFVTLVECELIGRDSTSIEHELDPSGVITCSYAQVTGSGDYTVSVKIGGLAKGFSPLPPAVPSDAAFALLPGPLNNASASVFVYTSPLTQLHKVLAPVTVTVDIHMTDKYGNEPPSFPAPPHIVCKLGTYAVNATLASSQYGCEAQLTQAGAYTASVKLTAGAFVFDFPISPSSGEISFNVLPGLLYTPSSSVTILESGTPISPSSAVTAGSTLVMSATPVDAYGNACPHLVDSVSEEVLELQLTAGNKVVREELSLNTSCTAGRSFFITKSGVYANNVTISGAGVTRSLGVSTSSINIVPGVLSASSSTVMKFSDFIYAGTNFTVLVNCRDVYGNPTTDFAPSLAKFIVASGSIPSSNMVARADGTFLYIDVYLTKAAHYHAKIEYNGSPLPYNISFSVYASQELYFSAFTVSGIGPTTAGDPMNVMVRARDRYHNAVDFPVCEDAPDSPSSAGEGEGFGPELNDTITVVTVFSSASTRVQFEQNCTSSIFEEDVFHIPVRLTVSATYNVDVYAVYDGTKNQLPLTSSESTAYVQSGAVNASMTILSGSAITHPTVFVKQQLFVSAFDRYNNSVDSANLGHDIRVYCIYSNSKVELASTFEQIDGMFEATIEYNQTGKCELHADLGGGSATPLAINVQLDKEMKVKERLEVGLAVGGIVVVGACFAAFVMVRKRRRTRRRGSRLKDEGRRALLPFASEEFEEDMARARRGKEIVQLQKVAKEWTIEYEDLELPAEGRLGAGTSGEVYMSSWRGTPVAVKRFYTTKLSDDDLREFCAECVLMSKLRHPNVILFIGACIQLPNLCLVTELMEKGNLRELLDSDEELTDDRKKRLSIDAACGMHYLHTMNPPLLHRDLKSPNLLVNSSLRVVVADFGISKVRNATAGQMTAVGSPFWAAPETLRCEDYDMKADVYSYGVVLWEIWTRRWPYSGENPIAVGMNVAYKKQRPYGIDDPAKRVEDLIRECADIELMPRQVFDLIRRCLSEDPAKRPDFGAILTELRSLHI